MNKLTPIPQHVARNLLALQSERDRLRTINADLVEGLEMALQYLDHPDVQSIPFAKRAETAAQQIRNGLARAKATS